VAAPLRRLGVFLVLAAGLLVAGRAAHAQPAGQRVERGLAQFQNLDFREAIETLGSVVDDPAASRSQRLVALELIGISELSLGHEGKARAAFRRLLILDPEHVLQNHDGSPKVSALFESVRKSLPERPPDTTPDRPVGPVPSRIEDVEIDGNRAGGRSKLTVIATGTKIKSLELHWWLEGEAPRVTPLRERKRGRWGARLSLPSAATDYRLHYYLLALGVAQERVDQQGSAEAPLDLEVQARRAGGGSPWYARWQVWAGVGAAVVAGSVGAVLLSGSEDQQGSLSPGRITLTP
jgi:hypothetical protein